MYAFERIFKSRFYEGGKKYTFTEINKWVFIDHAFQRTLKEKL